MTAPHDVRIGFKSLHAVAPAGKDTVTDNSFPDAVSLLEDEHARAILVAADGEPLSAAELAEQVNASPQTVYRRAEALTEADLLAEATRPRSDGHHETVYVTAFRQLRVRLRDGKFEASVETGDDAADRLTDLWRRF